jgi:hypothetical protein
MDALVFGLARQALTMIGAVAVTAGYITGGQLEALAGGAAVAVSLGWSWWARRK